MKDMPPPLGLTLVEVVIALFIFSVISILGAQALNGLTRSSVWIETSHGQHRELLILIRQTERDLAESMGLMRVTRDSQGLESWLFPATFARYELQKTGEIKRIVEMPGYPVRETLFNVFIKEFSLEVYQDGRWIAFDKQVPARSYSAFKIFVYVMGFERPLSKVILLEPKGL